MTSRDTGEIGGSANVPVTRHGRGQALSATTRTDYLTKPNGPRRGGVTALEAAGVMLITGLLWLERRGIFLLAVSMLPMPASAATVETESALTKMLVGEAGFAAVLDHTVMLPAIHLLDARESRSSNVIETMEIHIPWWNRGAPPGRPWVAGINTSCMKPAGFPKRLRWEGRHQRWCLQVVGRVRDYFAGRLSNPCKGTPDNWRARGRPSRRAKRLYVQIGCGRGSLHNWFDTRRKRRR